MDGLKDSHLVQLGREVKNTGGAGTAVAATAVWRGLFTWKNDTQIVSPQENVSLMLESTRSYVAQVLGSLKQGPDALTFEQFCYILASCIRGIEKGVKDGAGSGYIYNYTWPKDVASLSKTGTTLGFTTGTKVIADSGSGLGFIQVGDLIKVSGSASNNGIYTVTVAAAGSITVAEALVTEAAGAAVTIELLTQAYTVEAGNNKRVEEAAYGHANGFEVAGKGGTDTDAVTVSSDWFVRQWSISSFTPSITPPAVSEALFGNTRLFIDAIGGTMGATEKVNTLASFAFKADPNLNRQFGGSGNLFYNQVVRGGRPKLTCAVGMYHNDAALVEYDAWLAKTPRKLQIKIEGPALGTPGTVYSKKTILFNMPGMWVEFPELGDIEGADMFEATFKPAYDATAGIGPSITVVNELVSLP